MSDRRPIVAGNWKMHTTRASGITLARTIADAAKSESLPCDIAIFPPFVYLDAIVSELDGSALVRVGGQDVFHEAEGAFTGEVSPDMLKDVGCSMALTGHSERRHVIGESDQIVNAKTRAALVAGLTCVLCIGETLEQREAGSTDEVNERQLRAGLEGVEKSQLDRLVIAYEPVWAIGTGRTATPEDAQQAHERARAVLADLFDEAAAGRIRILYGGSVKPENAADLFAQPDIDGGLVGGASLKADSFCAIARAAG